MQKSLHQRTKQQSGRQNTESKKQMLKIASQQKLQQTHTQINAASMLLTMQLFWLIAVKAVAIIVVVVATCKSFRNILQLAKRLRGFRCVNRWVTFAAH